MMRLKQFLIFSAFLWFFGPLLTAEAGATKIEEYKKAIETNPKDFVAHLELGRAY